MLRRKLNKYTQTKYEQDRNRLILEKSKVKRFFRAKNVEIYLILSILDIFSCITYIFHSLCYILCFPERRYDYERDKKQQRKTRL